MICLGFDYGSTNSLIASFSGVSDGSVRILDRRPSATSFLGDWIPSPKRLLSEPVYDEPLVGGCISKLTKEMLASVPSSEDGIHMTVTLPNAFKNAQCKVVLDSVRAGCRLAFGRDDLCSVTILPEPVAAALYYVYLQPRDVESEGNVVVCDVGGGTTDLAVVRYRVSLSGGTSHIAFNVLCTDGDDRLGGQDIDAILVDHLRSVHGLPRRPELERTLLIAAKALKRKLSSARNHEVVEVALPDPYRHSPMLGTDGKPIVFQMTRKQFGDLLKREGFLSRLTLVAENLKAAYQKESPNFDLSGSFILPIGGTSLVPAVQETLCRVLGARMGVLPEVAGPLAPFESVAKGAAVYSAWRSGELSSVGEILIEGRTLHRISLLVRNGKLCELVAKNMPSGCYEYKDDKLIPVRDDGDGSFRLSRIILYEGDGDFVDDERYGARPVKLESYSGLLEHLDDRIFMHGRCLTEILIQVSAIVDKGRLSGLVIRIPQGKEDGSDYELPIDLSV